MTAVASMPETEPSLAPENVYRRIDDVVCRRVGNESVLVPIRQNVGDLDYIYTLSDVAARIWELLDGSRSVDAVISAICDEYEVDRDQAASDVAELVSDLASVSLVLQVSPTE